MGDEAGVDLGVRKQEVNGEVGAVAPKRDEGVVAPSELATGKVFGERTCRGLLDTRWAHGFLGIRKSPGVLAPGLLSELHAGV